jgi:hypothetical protein
MALIDRVKARIETDLDDAEVQAMIDGIVTEIERRYGPNGPITEHRGDERELLSHRRFIDVVRPIDTGAAIELVEIEPPNTGAAGNETTLAANDYRVLHGGRTVERLVDGTNGRMYWAPLVRITYTPLSDAAQREEAVIRLMQLAINDRGLASERAGDWAASYRDGGVEAEKILASLAPKRGLLMA